jgi:hypothetical protein
MKLLHAISQMADEALLLLMPILMLGVMLAILAIAATLVLRAIL